MASEATIIPFETEPGLHQTEPQTRGWVMGLVRHLTPQWLDEELSRVAEAGFNLLIFPAYTHGWTLFPSAAAREGRMPAIHPDFRKWDPMASLAGIAMARGLKLWAYVRPYDLRSPAPLSESRLLRKHPDWRLRAHPIRQTTQTYLTEQHHVCPFNPDYRRYVAGLMTELVGAYPIEGVVLDFGGFLLHDAPLETMPYCFCAACRELYRRARDADLIEDGAGERLAQVREWQGHQAAETLSYLRHRLIRARRSLRFMCRARPHWRELFMGTAGVAEPREFLDWPALMAQGAVEELLVDHDGDAGLESLGTRLAADYAYLGDRVMFQPIVPIAEPADLAQVLPAVARHPVPGFIVEFRRGLTNVDILEIQRRFFTQPAAVPESDPTMAAIYLLDRVRRTHENQPVIQDLLADFLRLLLRERPNPPQFATLEMIEENIHGLEQFIRRGRLGEVGIPDASMRDLGLARRFVRMACMDVRS